MAVSKPLLVASNFDFDDFWEPYARFLEGRIVQVIRQKEIRVQEEFRNHFELIEDLKISIPKAFRDDFKDGHSIVIDLVNDEIIEFFGDPMKDPILDINSQDNRNALSIFKGIFQLTNGSSLFVKLEFNFP